MKRRGQTKPSARKEGLIVQALPDETLVYDLDRDLAHCLNHTASLVWHRCDGRSTTKQISQGLAADLSRPVDEKLVWLALDQLGRHHLLEQGRAPAHVPPINRRELVRALAVSAAVAIPVVASIVAPVPAQAVSCQQTGACSSPAQCCSGVCNQGNCQGT